VRVTFAMITAVPFAHKVDVVPPSWIVGQDNDGVGVGEDGEPKSGIVAGVGIKVGGEIGVSDEEGSARGEDSEVGDGSEVGEGS